MSLGTMLILNKLLPVFALPLGLATLLIVIGTLRGSRRIVFGAVSGLLIASTPAVGHLLIDRLESQYPPVKIEQAGPADAVLVLGGMLGPRPAEGYLANWGGAVERFEGGVALIQAKRAHKLLFTAANIAWEGRVESEGAILRRRAIARGIAPEAVDLTRQVDNTRSEALAAADYCAQHGIEHLIVVTSAWHIRAHCKRSGRPSSASNPSRSTTTTIPTSASP